MSKNSHLYDYIIIGGGIAGSNIAYELSKHCDNLLLIEKNDSIAKGGSGAAGGFLSPLLGKPNKFKDLVNEAFVYSTKFYKKNMPDLIKQCGTLRLPKDKSDEKKFEEYQKYIDFKYDKRENGFYFPDASIVNSIKVCKALTKDINIQYDCEIQTIKYENNIWILNGTFHTRNLILTSGASKCLIQEFYLKVEPVWGQRIDIQSSTCLNHNYHKECSISYSQEVKKDIYKISIGATHHRNLSSKKIDKNDTQYLLNKANDILKLNDINVINEYIGERATSSDYFPIVGEIIDSKQTIKKFPSLKNGQKIDENKYIKYDNLYILNALGGRGFVLAPYLAKELSNLILNDIELENNILTIRLFKREVKRLN